MENNNFKIGDTVYYMEGIDSPVQAAKIECFGKSENTAVVKDMYRPWIRSIFLCDLYKAKEDAETEKKTKIEEIKDAYRNSITDVKSLVEFCFNNTTECCEEHTDYQAREVVIEKAKKLLNIELEN